MSDINAIANVTRLQMKDVAGLDLDVLMMLIQVNRTKQIDTQLKAQMAGVEARNDKIGTINEVMSKMNTLIAGFVAPNNKPDSTVGSVPGYAGPALEYGPGQGTYAGTTQSGCRQEQEINSLLKKLNLQPVTKGEATFSGYGRTLDDNGKLSYGDPRYYYTGGIGGQTTKAQLEAAVQTLRGTIDGLNNTQQMDMLKLQSLTNKRNEAFDLMTNFVKKMADSRSSILGNMR